MISVSIIGSGNVAYHLAKNLLDNSEVLLKQMFIRNPEDLIYWKHHLETIDNFDSLDEVDIIIIAVSDDSIKEVSEKLNHNFVVHTSGGKSINELENTNRKGVFYPLQSFSREKKVDFSQVPFCIETEHNEDLHLLQRLASALGSKTYAINSEKRQMLHVAAVFANNFSNHMFQQAYDICQTHKIPFDVLIPLIRETAAKIVALLPKEAQTGPAIRNDQQTIKKHLNLLSGNQKELYSKISESIELHGKEL